MGRGRSKARGTTYKGGAIAFVESKAGATYQSLPDAFKDSIKDNLTPSAALQNYIETGKGKQITDEWNAGLRGVKEKRKVLTKWENSRLLYTVKQGNKILLKDGKAEQAANQVALFYKKYLR